MSRVLGIDDCAVKEGQVYGTILVDQEVSQVADLLPERSAEAPEQWLQEHPAIVTCRLVRPIPTKKLDQLLGGRSAALSILTSVRKKH